MALSVLALVTVLAGSIAQAEETEVAQPSDLEAGVAYDLDLDGDGTTEQFVWQTTQKEFDDTYAGSQATLDLYVNGSQPSSFIDDYAYMWRMYQGQLEDGRTLLFAMSIGDNDYSEQRFGFGGFITAPLLLLYGAGAVIELYLGNGLILSLVHLIPHFIGKIILIVAGVLFVADLSGTLAVVWKWRRHVNRMAAWTDGMQQMTDTFGNAITRMIRKRLEKTYPNIRTEELVASKQKEEPPETACFAAGCGLYKRIWLFLIGAFLGDIVETIFCRITMGYWMSRSSVVYGPFSVVWGLACALLTAFLYKYKDKSDRYIFAYGTIVGGAYEYLCSVFTELLFGTTFWDYSDIPFNLGGRINLLYCFFWGIAAVVWLKGIYPLFSGWIEKIPKKIGPVLTWIAVILMIANMALSALALARYSARQTGAAPTNAIEQQLDEHFPDSRMQRIYPKAKFV